MWDVCYVILLLELGPSGMRDFSSGRHGVCDFSPSLLEMRVEPRCGCGGHLLLKSCQTSANLRASYAMCEASVRHEGILQCIFKK